MSDFGYAQAQYQAAFAAAARRRHHPPFDAVKHKHGAHIATTMPSPLPLQQHTRQTKFIISNPSVFNARPGRAHQQNRRGAQTLCVFIRLIHFHQIGLCFEVVERNVYGLEKWLRNSHHAPLDSDGWPKLVNSGRLPNQKYMGIAHPGTLRKVLKQLYKPWFCIMTMGRLPQWSSCGHGNHLIFIANIDDANTCNTLIQSIDS